MQDHPTLKGLRRGETESLADAITDLYLALRIDLWRLAVFKNFGPSADLEELLHDVFIDLYVHVSNGLTIDNPKAWIYKALLNKRIDRYRKAQRQERYLTSLPRSHNDDGQQVQQNLERAEILNRALDQLNFRERQILMMRLSGLTYEEIAFALDTTVSLVSVYIARALPKLRNPRS